MHTTIYKIGKPQGPTVEHRELYSNIVIIYNGKESEKTYIYICIHPHTKLNHFAMHLKLIHCKLTILQLKSKEELLSEILLCATHYTVVCVCMCVCVCVCVLSCVRLFATLWTIAHHAPLSMGFPRQECWSGLPFPSPTLLVNQKK